MGPPSFWLLLIILTFWQATKTPSSRHRHSTPWGQGQAPGRHTPCFCLIDESSHHQPWKRTYVHEWKRERLKGKWEGHRTKVPEVDMNSSVCRTFWTFLLQVGVLSKTHTEIGERSWLSDMSSQYLGTGLAPPDLMGIKPAYPLCSANPTRACLLAC